MKTTGHLIWAAALAAITTTLLRRQQQPVQNHTPASPVPRPSPRTETRSEEEKDLLIADLKKRLAQEQLLRMRAEQERQQVMSKTAMPVIVLNTTPPMPPGAGSVVTVK